eukprot:5680525-Pyramimonas_sp.AAC.1
MASRAHLWNAFFRDSAAALSSDSAWAPAISAKLRSKKVRALEDLEPRATEAAQASSSEGII